MGQSLFPLDRTVVKRQIIERTSARSFTLNNPSFGDSLEATAPVHIDPLSIRSDSERSRGLLALCPFTRKLNSFQLLREDPGNNVDERRRHSSKADSLGRSTTRFRASEIEARLNHAMFLREAPEGIYP